MSRTFDSFVVLAEMRTGSNFLESNLNAFEGVSCHGEAFNPHFIGYPNREDLLGVTAPERDADPAALWQVIRGAPGLNGCRYFHDHDPRILPALLEDPKVAKIVLTRNPAESYVSWKIAQATGQWKLTNVAKRRDALAVFDAAEFEAHLQALQEFQLRIMRTLQVSGQSAFYVAYEDLQDVDVMNGLARWLGVDARLEALEGKLKRQNPEPLSEKVANFEEMQAGVARLDRFNLSRTPNFEPRRGPAVPSYHAAAETPLIYMPVRSGPEREVLAWMAALDGVGEAELSGDFGQKTLREWKRGAPGHRSFTVIRHPVARAHAAFCERILSTGKGSFAGIRKVLRKRHGLVLPEGDYDAGAHHAAFCGFLEFVKANLAGQTTVRIDGHWASQGNIIAGFGDFSPPDMIVREAEMAVYLPALAQQVGHPGPPEPAEAAPATPHALGDIYDAEIERLARAAYGRDYLLFGFGDWR